MTFKEVVCEGSNGLYQIKEILDLLAHFFRALVYGLPAEEATELDILGLLDPAQDIFLFSLLDVRNHENHTILGLDTSKDLSGLLEGLIGEVCETCGSLKQQNCIDLIRGLKGPDCSLVLI